MTPWDTSGLCNNIQCYNTSNNHTIRIILRSSYSYTLYLSALLYFIFMYFKTKKYSIYSFKLLFSDSPNPVVLKFRDFCYQFSSVAQSCPTLCKHMNHCTLGLPVHHQLPAFTQTQVHRVSDAIQPSHPLSSPSSPAPNPSQHQSLFQWVNSSHEVAKVLEFQV